jgi:hypothetical protein
MLREDIKALRQSSQRDLRKFGLTVGGVFCLLGLLFFLRHKWWYPWMLWPGLPLLLLGIVLPRSLKWIYVCWMTLAMLMGAVVSTVLLVVLFYLVVTPIGFIARLAGKDFLSQKLDSNAASYWIVRDISRPKAQHEHEQQF